MVDDDNLAEDGLEPGGNTGSESESSGLRRATFTPPSSTSHENGQQMSDDELADALFADFEKLAHSGAIQIPTQSEDDDKPEVTETIKETTPIEDLFEPDVFAGPPPPPPSTVWSLDDHSGQEPFVAPGVFGSAPPVSEGFPDLPPPTFTRPPATSTPQEAPVFVSEPVAPSEPTVTEEPVVTSPPTRPHRQSLPVEEINAELGVTGGLSTIDALQKLEEQLQLRKKDADAFTAWQDSVMASGDAGAIAEVTKARAEFQDILEPGPTAVPSAPRPSSELSTTHTFRTDDVLDSRLLNMPAPMTAPVSDVPPPPTPQNQQSDPLIPDLVQPAPDAATGQAPFSFEDLLKPEEPVAATQPEFTGWETSAEEQGETLLDLPTPTNPKAGTAEKLAVASMRSPKAFAIEQVGIEPTPLEQRAGRASRQFWLWFALNSSVISVAAGGVILALGMSLRQALMATLIGTALSFLPLGLGTLAGKWSNQPTMVVSRASFGHIGNVLPSLVALLVRVFCGALLLWFLAAGIARILVGAELGFGLSESMLTLVGIALGFLIAIIVATFGYGLLAKLQMVVTILASILIVGLIVITWPSVNLSKALTVEDGPWTLVIAGSVLVFSFVGLAWAVSSSDLARYQRAASSGATTMLWSTFGATIPAFVLIAYGALLAASEPAVAKGLVTTPLDTIALMIPIWYPVPLLLLLALSLISGVALSMYSGGFALQATGVPLRRPLATVLVAILLGATAAFVAVSGTDFGSLLKDVATTLAVPVAAWSGIFGSEMMIRSKHFDSESLVKRGGRYPNVVWSNLLGLLIASAVGFGLTSASETGLEWQGYLFKYLGGFDGLDQTNVGVIVSLLIGLLIPIATRIPGIRKQELAVAKSATPATASPSPARAGKAPKPAKAQKAPKAPKR
ncbi:MAG: cytosine permease [Cryobacterium sp.]|nr:cytosine permease [Cryobacterium sp.]